MTSTLAGKRVLVVGINYSPEHTGIAPYTTQACEHLVAEGADVLVLAGVPHYPHWSVPDPYRRRLRVDEVLRDVPVRRLRHFVPKRQSALSRGSYEATFGLHVRTQRLPWRPDVLLAVVPSLLGAVAAASLARKHDARLVLWVQDLMGPATAQSGISGGRSLTRLTTKLEEAVLRSADQVVVLNEAFQGYVIRAGAPATRVSIVRNWTHVAASEVDRMATRARLEWAPNEVIALHTGNMGLKQGLENVLEAARLAEVQGSDIRFVLMGEGSQRADLEARGASLANLEFLPPVTAEQYPELLASADVLLVNERGSAVEMSLPSKLTSYFSAGGPVLGAVHPEGGTAFEITRSGAGVVVRPDDPQALLDGVVGVMTAGGRRAFAAAALEYVNRHLGSSTSLAQLVEAVGPNQPANSAA